MLSHTGHALMRSTLRLTKRLMWVRSASARPWHRDTSKYRTVSAHAACSSASPLSGRQLGSRSSEWGCACVCV